jgi:hypothetical protein
MTHLTHSLLLKENDPDSAITALIIAKNSNSYIQVVKSITMKITSFLQSLSRDTNALFGLFDAMAAVTQHNQDQ